MTFESLSAGKYAMRDLVQKLPSGNPQRDHGTSDDTIAAVLATLNEVIKKHPEFSRSVIICKLVELDNLSNLISRNTFHSINIRTANDKSTKISQH